MVTFDKYISDIVCFFLDHLFLFVFTTKKKTHRTGHNR